MVSTIPGALLRAAQDFGDTEAVADPEYGVRLTYAQLHDRVCGLAATLAKDGVEPGDRVAICAPNTHHWVVAALGILHAGGTLVPINTRFTGPEMLDLITRSEAKALFVANMFLGVDRLAHLRRAALDTPHQTPDVIYQVPDGWPEATGTASPRTDPEQVSDILFTSGTTGRSKGAMSAHRQSLGVAEAWARCAGLRRGDRYLVINPFFHSFGYKAGILACLLRGATIVPQQTFDVARTMELIERERITVLPGAPTIYQSMLDSGRTADLSTLRLAVTGAATVPVRLVERMRAELGFDTVLTAYGLTEAVVATMCRPDDDPRTVAHTSGRAVDGMEVRIAEGSGEILLRGPTVMLGYLGEQPRDPRSWLHTGDVGRLDERGYLTITDRLKDMYICGGFNVYPAEVEQVLARLTGLAESAVVGVPDERLGEVGKAYVIRSPGHELSTEDIIAHCRQRLANYKIPRYVEFATELPRNPSGKVLKRLLRSMP